MTNVLNSDKLIKTAVVLGISRDETDELSDMNVVLRDCILSVLRSQTEEQYQQADLQQQLSDANVGRLNELFPQEEGGGVSVCEGVLQRFCDAMRAAGRFEKGRYMIG